LIDEKGGEYCYSHPTIIAYFFRLLRERAMIIMKKSTTPIRKSCPWLKCAGGSWSRKLLDLMNADAIIADKNTIVFMWLILS
jgi:hypothetical protein